MCSTGIGLRCDMCSVLAKIAGMMFLSTTPQSDKQSGQHSDQRSSKGNQGESERTRFNDKLPQGFLSVTIALTCTLMVSFAMNVAAFPLFDTVFPPARDISQVFQALTFIVIGVLASYRPAVLRVVCPEVGALVLLLTGIIGVPLALMFENAALLTMTSLLFAIARGLVVMMVVLALVSFSERKVIILAIVLAFCFATPLSMAFWVLPSVVGFLFYALAPLAVFLMVRLRACPLIKRAITSAAPAETAVVQPMSFLPLASQFFVALFLFRVAFGISLRFGETTGVPVDIYLSAIPIVLGVVLLVAWKHVDADRLAQVSVVLVAAGLVFLISSDEGYRDISNLLLFSGNTLFNVVSWVVIVCVAARNVSGALAVAGWGNGVGSLGTIVGAAMGVQGNLLIKQAPETLTLLTALLMVCFVGYALIGLKNFSFTATIAGVMPAENNDLRIESPEIQFQKRCADIAEAYGLTPREQEVFAMLARGRNREYIQEKLVVSRNTVKAHVRHVYEKLGIHSHQELIDLVDVSEKH